MVNALGNEIGLGDKVIYSNKQNGWTTSFVGEVTGFTEQRVRIKVIKRGRASYDDPIKEVKIDKPTITAFGNSLIPVDPDMINWVAPE